MQQFKKYVLWLGFLVCCMLSKNIIAQRAPKKSKPLVATDNTLWVQYNPITLAEPEVPIAATFLYKKNTHWSFALDAGFFIARQDYSENGGGYHPYSGYRFKPEVKYFLGKHRRVPQGMYFSLRGLIKKTIEKKEDWLTSNGQPSFSQLVDFKQQKKVYGLTVIFGNEIYLGDNGRWMLDLYAGLGFRTKTFTAKNLPAGFTGIDYNFREGETDFIDLTTNGTYPALQLGLKFGYRIKGGK